MDASLPLYYHYRKVITHEQPVYAEDGKGEHNVTLKTILENNA
jgi:hypothetical protein